MTTLSHPEEIVSVDDLRMVVAKLDGASMQLLEAVLVYESYRAPADSPLFSETYQEHARLTQIKRTNALYKKGTAGVLAYLEDSSWVADEASCGACTDHYLRELDWCLRVGSGPVSVELEPFRIVALVPLEWRETVVEAVPALGLIAALALPNLVDRT